MNLLTCILTNNDCYKTNQKITPKGVMVHSTGSNNTNLKRYVQPSPNDSNYYKLLQTLGVNNNRNSWNAINIDKCVHAFIGKLADGSIASVQTLPWNHRGWHCYQGKKGSGNNTHISFEICEDGLNDANYFNKVYKEAVELTAYLCKEYNLNPLDDGVVICHSEGYRRGIASGHADVEHWFPKFGKSMNDFRNDVHNEINKEEDDDMTLTQEQFEEMFFAMIEKRRDNDSSSWSEESREWAINNGLLKGGSKLPDGTPNYMFEDFLTREQFITTLYRYAKMTGNV